MRTLAGQIIQKRTRGTVIFVSDFVCVTIATSYDYTKLKNYRGAER